MAYCTNCGGELFETSKFCPHCGTPVLEISSRSEDEKPKEYDTETVSNDAEGLPEVNTGVLTPEEQAAVLEMAAENILEDIPDIKKLDNETVSTDRPEPEKASDKPNEPAKEEIHKEEASKPEPQKPAEEEKTEKAAVPVSEPHPETVNIPAEPKKKGKGGIIAVIAILAAAAVCGAVFFFGQNREPVSSVTEQTEVITELTEMTETETVPESEAVPEVPETELPAETTTVSETEPVSETAPSSEVPPETDPTVSDTVSDIVSETALTEAPAAGGLHSADELAEGIIIEPDHQTAMGNAVSAEISLSAEGISTDILSSGVLFLAEYTSTASAPENLTPAAMVMTISGTPVEVTATSCSEGMVIFEYDVMTAAAEAAGFTAADIDSVAIKSTGVPIDVFRITILSQ